MLLELFYFESCPFCQKVLTFINQHNVKEIVRKDIHKNPIFADELFRIGGKKQVPCLAINGQALYESDEIIAWLKQRFTHA